MSLTPDSVATPPHRMSRSDYPFDSAGRYIDAWAAEGAVRYGRFINTDRTEDGRSDDAEPERRPLPPPRKAATPTRQPQKPASRPASTTPPKKPAASKPAPPKPQAKKPPPQKPAAKKSTTHTVKSGDTLSSLSRRYGVPIQSIKKANNLKSDRIINGRKLVIPRS